MGGTDGEKKAETEERVGEAAGNTEEAQIHAQAKRCSLKMTWDGVRIESSANRTGNSLLRSRPSTQTYAVDVPPPFRLKRDLTGSQITSVLRRRGTNDPQKF